MNLQFNRQSLFTLLLLLALGSPTVAQAPVPSPLDAEVRSAPAEVVLADGWDVGRVTQGRGRTRIVQVCAVVMSIALYIMMRKLH
jgi:hypothetical protein